LGCARWAFARRYGWGTKQSAPGPRRLPRRLFCPAASRHSSAGERDAGPSLVEHRLTAYELEKEAPCRVPCPDGSVLEIPMSIGYSRRPFAVWGVLLRTWPAALRPRTSRTSSRSAWFAGSYSVTEMPV